MTSAPTDIESQSRRSVSDSSRPKRRVRPWLWALGLVLFLLAFDGLAIEPYRVEVTHSVLQAKVDAPLKIAQLTDLHTHGLGPRERRVVRILAAEQPDVIVITGDSLGGYGGTYRESAEVYRQLHAPMGVWFVRGNWENDHPIRPAREERQFYADAGVHLLVNANAELRPDVWLIGLNDPSSGPVRLETAMAGIPSDAYKIAIFHAPGYFDRIAGQVNLVLAGHTHGGQVHIPFVKPFWLPKDSGRYLAGWYQEAGSKMYVSRGVGMSNAPVRFLCRPEVAIITLEPDSHTS
jgi:predicted MPP superfamily phosphohydrolase